MKAKELEKIESSLQELYLEREKISLLEMKCALYNDLKQTELFDMDYISTMIFGDEKEKITKK